MGLEWSCGWIGESLLKITQAKPWSTEIMWYISKEGEKGLLLLFGNNMGYVKLWRIKMFSECILEIRYLRVLSAKSKTSVAETRNSHCHINTMILYYFAP